MSQPTARVVAAAERHIPKHYRTDKIVGQTAGVGGHPTIYTDGSVSHRRIAKDLGQLTGWGYLSTTGDYGCGKTPQFAKAGDDLSDVTELRAVWYAAGHRIARTPLTIVTDSQHAAHILTSWQTGSTRMPAGYTGSRSARRTPTLERLRRLVNQYPGNLTVTTTRGHAGDILNEAADTLAQLGMRWARDDLTTDDVRRRAGGIASGFLTQWRAP